MTSFHRPTPFWQPSRSGSGIIQVLPLALQVPSQLVQGMVLASPRPGPTPPDDLVSRSLLDGLHLPFPPLGGRQGTGLGQGRSPGIQMLEQGVPIQEIVMLREDLRHLLSNPRGPIAHPVHPRVLAPAGEQRQRKQLGSDRRWRHCWPNSRVNWRTWCSHASGSHWLRWSWASSVLRASFNLAVAISSISWNT